MANTGQHESDNEDHYVAHPLSPVGTIMDKFRELETVAYKSNMVRAIMHLHKACRDFLD